MRIKLTAYYRRSASKSKFAANYGVPINEQITRVKISTIFDIKSPVHKRWHVDEHCFGGRFISSLNYRYLEGVHSVYTSLPYTNVFLFPHTLCSRHYISFTLWYFYVTFNRNQSGLKWVHSLFIGRRFVVFRYTSEHCLSALCQNRIRASFMECRRRRMLHSAERWRKGAFVGQLLPLHCLENVAQW